ncbi:hypothetical protein AFCA_010509 [Aspergillus flavus]|nr:hypothetical protein AFCA_010509 [Aspergillus flavus]
MPDIVFFSKPLFLEAFQHCPFLPFSTCWQSARAVIWCFLPSASTTGAVSTFLPVYPFCASIQLEQAPCLTSLPELLLSTVTK